MQEAAEFAGARKPVLVIEEPMAAAIGSGLPVHEPAGNMIVDIGGGTTEVAVISLGGIVVSESSRVGGDEFDEAIINFVKREYSLALGERTAEEVKVQLASAWPLEEEIYAEVRGRDLVSGLPKVIVISTLEIREAIEEPTAAIVDAVKVTLDKTPPELAADIMERGIVITGGGAAAHRAREHHPGRDGHAGPSRAAPALLGGARLGPVSRELRCAPPGPEHRPTGLTAPAAGACCRIMAVYRQDRRRRITLVLLIITSLVLITLDQQGTGVVCTLRSGAQDVISPLQDVADSAISPGHRLLRQPRAGPTSSRRRTSACGARTPA